VSLTKIVVDTVILVVASYATILLSLLAVSVALVVKLRSVIPQKARVSPILRRPSKGSSVGTTLAD
jgi:hypothetical protein